MLEFNLDPAVPSCVQHPLPRRQVVSVLALTVGETGRAPRSSATMKKVRYFGPHGTRATWDTLDALTASSDIRTCTNHFFDQRARAGRPCLYYDIGRCPGPRVPTTTGITRKGRTGATSTRSGISSRGNSGPVLRRLEEEMAEASGREEKPSRRRGSATSLWRRAGR